ncbi:MAG: biotin/lipoyl-containing protein, partial [Pseudomonadota bacterium]
MDITIPSLGDIDEVEVIELCVAPGDYVEENDTLLVIESDKASMDLPASVAGTVDSILVAVGDMVSEGHAVAVVTPADAPSSPAAEAPSDTDADSAPSEAGPAAEVKAESATTPADTSSTASTESQVEVLVPDIGDAGDVVVIEIAVQAGDEVAVNDLLVVLESDKASMEIA